jgi:phosphate-selective porin
MLPRSLFYPAFASLPYPLVSKSALSAFQRGKNMRSLTQCLLCVLLMAPMSLIAEDKDPAGKTADSASATVTREAPAAATREEVEQLRKEVAAQKQTIEELKAMVQQLAAQKSQTAPGAISASTSTADTTPAHVVNATFTMAGDSDPLEAQANQKAADKKDPGPMPTAGWNGEHFFLRSPDGTFTLLPLGYLNTNYTFYHGDGVPADTFTVRRARFGFLGTYGSKVDYAFLFDAAATNGISIRDMYANFKPWQAFQIQAGQFKEPFSQEIGTAITNVEFLERSVVTVLYPSAAGVFRAPGVAIHGDLHGGVVQYWAGIFNGKGITVLNTTNEPEVLGRLRFSPWRKNKNSIFQGFTIGGSIEHSRSRGLAVNSNGSAVSPELSFNGTINDSAFTFFPQFRINGGIERYNGEFLWLKGRWGLRSEYTQILEKREGLGSFTPGGIGFENIPGVVGKGAYVATTYLLSGEREPENAIPRVKHPVIGPPTPGVDGGSPGWGAWQLKFRYSWLEGKAGGANFASQFTPENVAPFSAHMDQFSMGANWYINYWVLLKLDFNIDRLRNPSVQGILPQNYFVALQGLQFRF